MERQPPDDNGESGPRLRLVRDGDVHRQDDGWRWEIDGDLLPDLSVDHIQAMELIRARCFAVIKLPIQQQAGVLGQTDCDQLRHVLVPRLVGRVPHIIVRDGFLEIDLRVGDDSPQSRELVDTFARGLAQSLTEICQDSYEIKIQYFDTSDFDYLLPPEYRPRTR